MQELKALKLRITFFITMIGVSLMLAAVMSNHWAVMSPKVDDFTQPCDVAHFGLWKLCTKRIFVEGNDVVSTLCGPLSLPGGRCSLFIPLVTMKGL